MLTASAASGSARNNLSATHDVPGSHISSEFDSSASCSGETCDLHWSVQLGCAGCLKAVTFTVSVTFNPSAVASVEITPDNATIMVGEATDLTAEAIDACTPLTGRSFGWTSSPDGIVMLAAPLPGETATVTGLAAGDATVTATAEGVSDIATITVEPLPPVEVEVSSSVATITVGEMIELTAVAKDAMDNTVDDQTFAWESSDNAIGTVDPNTSDGTTTVTGVAEGEVTIMATITTAPGTPSGTSTITVDPPPALPPIVLEDDFSVGDMWDEIVSSASGGATSTWVNRVEGGVTGAGDGYRHMTHDFPGAGSIQVFHQYNGGSYNPQVDGAIDHIDYSESRIVFDPPFAGAGVGAVFVVVQNGTGYRVNIGGADVFANLVWEKGEGVEAKLSRR